MKMKLLVISSLIGLLFLVSNGISQKMNIKMSSGETKDYSLQGIDSLKINKISGNPVLIAPDSVDFGSLLCEHEQKTIVMEISNSGSNDLYITHFEIYPDTHFRFENSMPTALQLAGGEKYTFNVIFNPNSDGNHIADVKITSNSSTGLITKIKLTGAKNSVNFSILNENNNIGELCPNVRITKNIQLVNNATNDITLNVITDNIETSDNVIQLKGSSTIEIPVVIKSSANEGYYTGKITFLDKCQNESETDFNWYVANYALESVSQVELFASPGETDTAEIVFKNLSVSKAVTITSIELPTQNISLLESQTPIRIDPSQSAKVKIVYKPLNSNDFTGEITIHSEPCGVENKIIIKGYPGNKVIIFQDDFEDYQLGEFPYSGGWILKTYPAVIDTLPYISSGKAYDGNQSLYGWGWFGPPESQTSFMRIPIKNLPEEIYAECSIMINQVGFCGLGFMKMGSEMPITPIYVDFSNHGHFYYGLGNEEYRWENDGYGFFLWYKIKIRYNKTYRRLTIWVNDEQVADRTCITLPDNPFDEFYIKTGGGHHFAGSCYFDAVKVWYNK